MTLALDPRVSLNTGGSLDVVCMRTIKKHLNIEHTFDDPKIELAAQTAVTMVEQHSWTQILQATRTLHIPKFLNRRKKDYSSYQEPRIYLPYPPLVSVESLKYYADDASETLTTVSTDDYRVHTVFTPGIIEFKDTFVVPVTADRADAVQINFTCGYDGIANVPKVVQQALLFLTRYFYEKPEMMGCDDASQLPGYYRSVLGLFSMKDERTRNIPYA